MMESFKPSESGEKSKGGFSDQEFNERLARETAALIEGGVEAKEAERIALEKVLKDEKENRENRSTRYDLGGINSVK